MEEKVDYQIVHLNGQHPDFLRYITKVKELDQLMDYPWSDDSWSSLRDSEHYWLSILIWENRVRAFTLFSKIEKELHLLKILVDPTFRGKGFGKKLLESDLDVHFLGWESCFLEVREDNLSAISLYSKFNFFILHKVNNFYSDGCSALRMSLTYSNT